MHLPCQADGTLDELVADEAVLSRMLAPLGGSGQPLGASAATAQATELTAAQPGYGSSIDASGCGDSATAAASQVQQQLQVLSVNGSNGTGSSSSAGAGSSTRAVGSSSSIGSSRSWCDPDDGVREALAEAIEVLVSGGGAAGA